MAEIQAGVIKLGKRNPVSQLFHAKSDKEAIAAWRQELNSVLHIFNVRPARSVWDLLTIALQTKLSIRLVADMYRGKTGQEGADGQHSVSVAFRPPAKEFSLSCRLKLGLW